MFEFKKPLQIFKIGFLILLGLFIFNSSDLIAVLPEAEFVGNMRIVNSTVTDMGVLEKHASFSEYFDFKQPNACYNGNLGEFGIMWKIKNAPHNLLGVFFDDGTRIDEDDRFTLEELKQMGNGAQNMYIFWQYQQK
ncbi:conserved hypothetical protein [Candidatus Phytoplasma mali]|uniref:Uncharacterized protein n=1 Tax=Phytoplasma mali (strain AT) TaxID=482235 RepID=B3R0R5_PHYMT|nr:hypothetical protein [Candidatus Phytoplasma mali]CAP18649.1 conserved hypothetical protein [Candidatus Phytoplasma mali]